MRLRALLYLKSVSAFSYFEMTLEAIRYNEGVLTILDQLLLPFEVKYIGVESVKDAWNAIRQMQVRGAPAIAIVGALSLAVELRQRDFQTKSVLDVFIVEQCDYLVTSRPTAVNMKNAARRLKRLAGVLHDDDQVAVEVMKQKLLAVMENMLEWDIATNKSIGDHGAQHIMRNHRKEGVNIVTHCNTGSLATGGYGTALGVIRSVAAAGALGHVFCTETRPYSQGSRLTAFELVHDQLPATLICDVMAAWLMNTKDVTAVVVGADRVAANGDTANKIGTYQLAIVAKYHEVPFYVAAPTTSIDFTLPHGKLIPIEERPQEEVTHIKNVPIAAPGINCWNPSFDVTPAELITGGIVTEKGVFAPSDLVRELMSLKLEQN